jgi:hypothetical protein
VSRALETSTASSYEWQADLVKLVNWLTRSSLQVQRSGPSQEADQIRPRRFAQSYVDDQGRLEGEAAAPGLLGGQGVLGTRSALCPQVEGVGNRQR